MDQYQSLVKYLYHDNDPGLHLVHLVITRNEDLQEAVEGIQDCPHLPRGNLFQETAGIESIVEDQLPQAQVRDTRRTYHPKDITVVQDHIHRSKVKGHPSQGKDLIHQS